MCHTQPTFQQDPKTSPHPHRICLCKNDKLIPKKGLVSTIHSPNTIIPVETLLYKRHLELKIGQYWQFHEEDTKINGQSDRKKAAICLGPSGNTLVGFKVMSLHSVKKITRRNRDVIPMPDTIIARVNELTKGEPEQFVFIDRKGRIIGDAELTGLGRSGNEESQKNHDI